MEVLHETPVLKFNVDTLQYLRKQYDLDKPERLEESINHLIDWLKKQDHFLKKDYSREYLERTLIISKGSIEKSKVKLDKTCTLRSLVPEFYENFDIQNSPLLNDISCYFLPKMTKDYYRVVIYNIKGQRFEAGFLDIYRYCIRICEYLQANDYSTGIIGVFDFTDTNIMDMLKAVNMFELLKFSSIIIWLVYMVAHPEGFEGSCVRVLGRTKFSYGVFSLFSVVGGLSPSCLGEHVKSVPRLNSHWWCRVFDPLEHGGYGMRLKGLYFITPSKAIDAIVSIVKQAVSSKVSQRIAVCKDMEQLNNIIPKIDLPVDYGGKEKSITELSNKLKKELSSKEFNDYFNEMKEACTDESYRSKENFNDQCLGMPGSFRKLTVD
ncbi:unnamed protein product, partial [Brenthis ino]